jgi:NTE family protein
MKHTDIADPTASPAALSVPRKPTVALALGAGGAKGLAHIGAIEEIEAQGFEIIAIAGTSMGALIGGIYAMGKLEVYRDWVSTLAKFDVLKLLDWTFSGGGLIKGERIIGTLLRADRRHLHPGTAVSLHRRGYRSGARARGVADARLAVRCDPRVDRDSHRVSPLSSQRACTARRRLLNPLPVTPLIRDPADYLFAVSMDGPAEFAPVEIP